MRFLVLPHRSPPTNPAPERSIKDHARFVRKALVTGVAAFGARLGAITALVGGSALGYALFVKDLPLPWAAAICLAVALVVFVIGACKLFNEAYTVALRYAPTWQRLQQRADTLWAIYHADRGEGNASFRQQFAATHSVAAQDDLDSATSAGFPLEGVTRDDIRQATLDDLPTVAAAFDDAARRMREAEERGER